MEETPLKTLLVRLIGFSIYVLIGGVVFMQIEKEEDQNAAEQTLDDFLLKWMKTCNISRENVTNIYVTRFPKFEREWIQTIMELY